MKVASILIALLLRWAVADKPDYEAMWMKFKNTYNKYQQVDEIEEQHRFNVFKANVDIIIAHNEKNLSYSLGVNEYADLTWEEFSKTHLGFHKGDKLKALS